MSAALRFVQASNQTVYKPELLGLPRCTGETVWVAYRAQREFVRALIDGEEERARSILVELFLAGWPMHRIGDVVIAKSFQQIGEKWHAGDLAIYQERRACEISNRCIRDLLQLLETPSRGSPLAVGGAAKNDRYALPNLLVELTLRSCGWRTSVLGEDLPFETMRKAILDNRPDLFWISVAHIEDETCFVDSYSKHLHDLPTQTSIVLGGQGITEEVLNQIRYTIHCKNLQELHEMCHRAMKNRDEHTGRLSLRELP